jgi:hypothetical protein
MWCLRELVVLLAVTAALQADTHETLAAEVCFVVGAPPEAEAEPALAAASLPSASGSATLSRGPGALKRARDSDGAWVGYRMPPMVARRLC